MRTKIRGIGIFVVMVIGLAVSLAAQNAYYNALQLTKLTDSDMRKLEDLVTYSTALTAEEKAEIRDLIAFLDKPLDYAQGPDGESQLMDAYRLVQKILPQYEKYMKPSKTMLGEGSRAPIMPSAGAETVSARFSNKAFQRNLIDAVGTLIAERFKEDLTTIYLTKFKDKLEKSEFYNEIKILFPATTQLLDQVDIFTYFSLGNQWKSAFQKDLDAMPDNLMAFMDKIEADHPDWIKPGLVPYLELTIEVGVRLLYGYHPVEILNALDIAFSGKKADPDYQLIYQALHTANLFQENLQRVEQSSAGQDTPKTAITWINFSEFENLLVKPKGLEYFLALIYLQDKDFFSQSKVGELMVKSQDFLEHYLNPCLDILNRIKILEEKSTSTKEDYLTYMELAVALFQDTYTLIAPEGKESPVIFEIVESTLDIFQSIYQKDYYGVIADALFILDKIEADNTNEVTGGMRAVRSFAAFIEGLASAQNTDQMKGVISDIILPPGGFMTNRTSKFSISITAHPGVYAGAESLDPQGDSLAAGQPRWGSVVGFTAPLGVEFCFGSLGKSHKSSLGLFASLVDLGAVVSYRLTQKKDEYDGLPDDISLKQVFSPGLSLNIGFKNSPLTLGIGWQYTPELRKITVTADQGQPVAEIKTNTHRLFLRLSWAIPLIHIYHHQQEPNR